MKKDIKRIGKRIYEFMHQIVESLINQCAIVENRRITQEVYEELLKILDEWKV